MNGLKTIVTERTLKAWLAAGAVDRSVGDALTFVASQAAAQGGKAAWVLRYRHAGMQREKIIGRWPEVTLKDARELARQDRARLDRGEDIAAAKVEEHLRQLEGQNVQQLGELWMQRSIVPRYKHPEVVHRVLNRHIYPAIGKLALGDVSERHVDLVLTRVVAAGAPTVANDVLRYLFRMFHFAVKRRWVAHNPAANFDIQDAGGSEQPRDRWLKLDELKAMSAAMREAPSFGRINELAVWLLLALCVRKMELLSARWADFDLDAGIWRLLPSRTKTRAGIEIPLADPVIAWLDEVKVFSCGSEYVFPARRLVRARLGAPVHNRFPHVGPDTLNVALRRLDLADLEHFTVHDMRRTARTHMAALGIDRFVAERSLNHKLRDVEGTYNRYDYFAERRQALAAWAQLLQRVANGEPVPLPLENRRNPSVAARRGRTTLTGGLRGVAHDARDRHPAQQRPATVVRPTAHRHANDRPGPFDDLPAGRPR